MITAMTQFDLLRLSVAMILAASEALIHVLAFRLCI
jgi:hypothetical protein